MSSQPVSRPSCGSSAVAPGQANGAGSSRPLTDLVQPTTTVQPSLQTVPPARPVRYPVLYPQATPAIGRPGHGRPSLGSIVGLVLVSLVCAGACTFATTKPQGSKPISAASYPALATTSTVSPMSPGITSSTASPASAVPANSTVSPVSAGRDHTCALLSGGTVKCWGWNSYGQLGDGTTTASSTPVALSGLTGLSAISAGAYHTCALLSGGTVECWGWNAYGQLGDGTTNFFGETTPVAVSGLSGASAISAGGDHTCAVLRGATVKCWGYNNYGQLGDGTTTDSPTPVTVRGL
jgi:hypothetical protein